MSKRHSSNEDNAASSGERAPQSPKLDWNFEDINQSDDRLGVPEVFNYHRAGDIIFSRDRSIVSHALRLGQRALDRSESPFSHAAICLVPGLLMHSVPVLGVHVLSVEEDHPEQISFARSRPGDIRVLRLEKCDGKEHQLVENMMFFAGQSYNYRFIGSSSMDRSRSFCSQLIVRVLFASGIDIESIASASFVTPSALYRALSKEKYIDVTDQYIRYAKILLQSNVERKSLSNSIYIRQIKKSLNFHVELGHASSLLARLTDYIQLQNTRSVVDGARPIGIIQNDMDKFDGLCDGLKSLLNDVSLLFQHRLFTSLAPRYMRHWTEGIGKIELPELKGSPLDLIASLEIALEKISILSAEFEWLLNRLDDLEERSLENEEVNTFLDYVEKYSQQRREGILTVISHSDSDFYLHSQSESRFRDVAGAVRVSKKVIRCLFESLSILEQCDAKRREILAKRESSDGVERE